MRYPLLLLALGAALCTGARAEDTTKLPRAEDAAMASFAVDTEVKLVSDQRNRGISDSLNRPGAQLSIQMAHESGVIGLVFVVINLVVDLLYYAVDPRLRVESGGAR